MRKHFDLPEILTALQSVPFANLFIKFCRRPQSTRRIFNFFLNICTALGPRFWIKKLHFFRGSLIAAVCFVIFYIQEIEQKQFGQMKIGESGIQLSFENQVAIVTGGATGLGFAIAMALKSKGVRVAVLDKYLSPLKNVGGFN